MSTVIQFVHHVLGVLITIRFGEEKECLSEEIRKTIPVLSSKTTGETHTINADGLEKDDIIGYFQLVKNLFYELQTFVADTLACEGYEKDDEVTDDHFMINNIIELFSNMEKYDETKPFTHICKVAEKLGDIRFPNPLKAIYSRLNIKRLKEMMSALSRYRVACRRLCTDYRNLPGSYTREQVLQMISLEQSVIASNKFSLPLVTIVVTRYPSYLSMLKELTIGDFDIDFTTVSLDSLTDVSLYVLVICLLRKAILTVDSEEGGKFMVKSHYYENERIKSMPIFDLCPPKLLDKLNDKMRSIR